MPKSWSAQKRRYHDGQAHQQRPDLDNLVKAWCDVWGIDDGFVWRVRAEKRWGEEGRIEVTDVAEELYEPDSRQ
jgi:Holliday junction resolvase RusA-like endonuclease